MWEVIIVSSNSKVFPERPWLVQLQLHVSTALPNYQLSIKPQCHPVFPKCPFLIHSACIGTVSLSMVIYRASLTYLQTEQATMCSAVLLLLSLKAMGKPFTSNSFLCCFIPEALLTYNNKDSLSDEPEKAMGFAVDTWHWQRTAKKA